MLSEQDYKILIARAQAGDDQTREYLIEQNLNLVRSIIKRFSYRGYEWDDLFQIGCIGLVKAIDRFNFNYNVKFSTYAVPMIIGEIRRFIRDDNSVKVSRSIKELGYKIHRTQEKLQGDLGREPTIQEVATELSIVPQEIISAMEALQTPSSLYDQAYHDDGDSTLVLDYIKSDSGGLDNRYIEHLDLQEIIAKLPEKEKKVIQLRFYQDKTQSEIAETIGLSQVQVSRIEKSALKMIRELMQTS